MFTKAKAWNGRVKLALINAYYKDNYSQHLHIPHKLINVNISQMYKYVEESVSE